MITINNDLAYRLESLSHNSFYGLNAHPLQEVDIDPKELLEQILISHPELAQQVMKTENSINSTNFAVHGKELYEGSI